MADKLEGSITPVCRVCRRPSAVRHFSLRFVVVVVKITVQHMGTKGVDNLQIEGPANLCFCFVFFACKNESVARCEMEFSSLRGRWSDSSFPGFEVTKTKPNEEKVDLRVQIDSKDCQREST